MATFAFKDLITPVTRDEAKASIYAAMTALGLKTTAWEAGAVTRTIVTACALMFSALSQLQADIARSGFLDYAQGSWLKLVARFVYNVEPFAATFATGEITLTNTGGGLFEVDPGDLIVANAVTGKTYRNVSAFVLSPSATITVEVVALEAGSGSNANVGEITAFVTTLNRVEVDNAEPLTGIDEETDPAIRARCREKLGALSPFGPWDAYSYAARTAKVANGATAGVTRTAVTRDGYGNVYVRVASASGTIIGSEGDLNTPLGAVIEAVEQAAAPLSVTAHVSGATPVLVPIVYEAWAYDTSGESDAGIRGKVATNLAINSTTQPIGGAKLSAEDANGYAFADQIRAQIAASMPEIYHVNLISPAADQVITPSQVAVWLHDPNTQATITQVPRPEGSVM